VEVQGASYGKKLVSLNMQELTTPKEVFAENKHLPFMEGSVSITHAVKA